MSEVGRGTGWATGMESRDLTRIKHIEEANYSQVRLLVQGIIIILLSFID